jgi:hypothetical protein
LLGWTGIGKVSANNTLGRPCNALHIGSEADTERRKFSFATERARALCDIYTRNGARVRIARVILQRVYTVSRDKRDDALALLPEVDALAQVTI